MQSSDDHHADDAGEQKRFSSEMIDLPEGEDRRDDVHDPDDHLAVERFRHLEARLGEDPRAVVDDDVDAGKLRENRNADPQEERPPESGLEQLADGTRLLLSASPESPPPRAPQSLRLSPAQGWPWPCPDIPWPSTTGDSAE